MLTSPDFVYADLFLEINQDVLIDIMVFTHRFYYSLCQGFNLWNDKTLLPVRFPICVSVTAILGVSGETL